MNIVYDNIIFGIQRNGGISVVWRELLSRMQNHIQNIRYVDVAPHSNYSRNMLDIPTAAILQRIRYPKLSRYLNVGLQVNQPFIFHSSYYRYCTNRNAINITTVHDFTYEFFIKGLKKSVHSWQKFSAIRNSAAVVCISENTKRDLLKLMPDLDESKVRVIYNGVSEYFCQLHESAEEAQLPFPEKSYVVFIGRRDNYKNFNLTVRGIASTSLNLLIIGNQLSKLERREIEQYLPHQRYQCLSYIPDERLNQLYNHAAALVYPSAYEGFGLPVLEAQRAGCPVIALNASAIPEVIGHTPLLMQKNNETELVQRLNMLSDSSLMKRVIDNGLLNAQRFSWDNMTKQYLHLYEELLVQKD